MYTILYTAIYNVSCSLLSIMNVYLIYLHIHTHRYMYTYKYKII